MEFGSRWTKILKDIWGNKPRSLLVIFSIAIGVAAIGMINNTIVMLRRDLFGAYGLGNPASVQIYISPFQDNLAAAVEGMREVSDAQAHRTVAATLHTSTGRQADIELNAYPDFTLIDVSRFELEQGTGNPAIREVLLERQGAKALGVQIGDSVVIETDDDQQYTLQVAGIVHDLYIVPYKVTRELSAYMSMDTLRWMDQGAYYNRLDVVVAESPNDRQHVLDVGAVARDRVIEPSGYTVYRVGIPGINADPGQHWAQNQINGFVLVLQVMSVLAIFLSAGLVVNTISAILGQQIKQIGIMRSVGAIRRQLIGMYVANVIVYSIAGLVIGLPLGLLGAWWLTSFAASYLNFDVSAITLDPVVTGLQIGVGLIMPVAVALYPITAGTRISIYDAIYQYGLSSEGDGGWIEAMLSKLRNLHPPLMLSLRNTFRKKTRLAFTLITLTLAGAMFMSVFSTRASLNEQITQVSRYVAFDASVNLVSGVTRTTAEREAMRIPGVTVAEGWSAASGILIHTDGSEGEEIQLNGIPLNSQTVEPLLIAGRWLEEGDTQQIIVNEDLLEKEPQIHVGGTIVIKVNGHERTYDVVGVASKHLSGPRVYMTYGTFAKATDRSNQADMVRIRLNPAAVSSPAEQKQIGQILQSRFQDAGLSTGTSRTQAEIFSDFSGPFDIILIVLIVMAGLLAVVGGLSLTGTIGMNVMERTREIGVLRALGANNVAIRQVVVIEGVVVGAMSWLFSVIVSGPAGFVLAGAVVGAVLKSQVSYRYSVLGLGAWLIVVLLIGVFASLAPAQSAAQLTVREVLDYE